MKLPRRAVCLIYGALADDLGSGNTYRTLRLSFNRSVDADSAFETAISYWDDGRKTTGIIDFDFPDFDGISIAIGCRT